MLYTSLFLYNSMTYTHCFPEPRARQEGQTLPKIPWLRWNCHAGVWKWENLDTSVDLNFMLLIYDWHKLGDERCLIVTKVWITLVVPSSITFTLASVTRNFSNCDNNSFGNYLGAFKSHSVGERLKYWMERGLI